MVVVLYFYMPLDCPHLTTPFSFRTLQCCSFAFQHQKIQTRHAFEETVREGSAGRGLLSAFQKKAGQFCKSFLKAVHTSIYDFYDNAWRKRERHFQGVSLINRSHDRVPFRFWCVKPSFPWNLHIVTAQTPCFFDLGDIENHCPSVWAQFFNVERSSSGREKVHEQIRKMVGIDWWKPYAPEDPRLASF